VNITAQGALLKQTDMRRQARVNRGETVDLDDDATFRAEKHATQQLGMAVVTAGQKYGDGSAFVCDSEGYKVRALAPCPHPPPPAPAARLSARR
jgi:hypothetical protein